MVKGSDLVVPSNSLKRDLKINKLVDQLKSELKDLLNIEKRFDLELIKYVCNKVENVFKHAKKYKINKKDIAIEIIQKLVGNLSENDKLIISNNIESLHSNNQIKAEAVLKVIFKSALNFLVKSA
jgi:hypothetical protein